MQGMKIITVFSDCNASLTGNLQGKDVSKAEDARNSYTREGLKADAHLQLPWLLTASAQICGVARAIQVEVTEAADSLQEAWA